MSEFDQDLAVIVEMIDRGDINGIVIIFEELLEENSELRKELSKRKRKEIKHEQFTISRL
jgi:phage gp29-like protein